MKILQKMLKQDLTHFLSEKNKQVIRLMKDQLGRQVMKKIFCIKSKNIELFKRQ